jgi:hypothetical protein
VEATTDLERWKEQMTSVSGVLRVWPITLILLVRVIKISALKDPQNIMGQVRALRMQAARKATKRVEIAGGARFCDYLSNIKRMGYTPLVNRTRVS